MTASASTRRRRALPLAAGSVLALALASLVTVPANSTAPVGAHAESTPKLGKHVMVTSGLDNPRQLNLTPNGDVIVAEAGHGSYNSANCSGSGGNRTCVGRTGSVIRIHNGHAHTVISGLLSGAGPDGSFATGGDGVSKRSGNRGAYFSIVTYAPPDLIPQGLPGWQAGRLLRMRPNGHLRGIANIARFEQNNDVDGEGVDTNPYSVLALKHRVLVADAAADYIAQVKGGKVSVWATLPEYGPKVDAVPTVVSQGRDGNIYVGELHSEIPGKAKVWKLDRRGNLLRSWGHFTTVTGVARGADGSLYVSELFGGSCTFDDIPKCFPGRVVKIAPNGQRSYRRVPFPAGVVVTHGKVYVAAFSVSPATGFGGNPAWSGAVWQIFR